MAHPGNLTSQLAPRLLSNGGPQSAYQLVKRAIDAGPTHSGMFKVDSVVAVYETHDQAEEAVRTLQGSGIDMKTLSIAGKTRTSSSK